MSSILIEGERVYSGANIPIRIRNTAKQNQKAERMQHPSYILYSIPIPQPISVSANKMVNDVVFNITLT